MAKPNFILPNKPAIKAGSILSYNYTDDLTFAAEPFDFSRNSSATRVNEQGLIETTSANLPRIDYSDSLTEPSSLLEPQSTNLVHYSEDFSNSSWTKRLTTIVSNNSTSPDGQQTADKMVSSNLSRTEHKIVWNGAIGNTTYSIYAKQAEVRYIMLRVQLQATSWKSVVFDLQNGTIAANNYSSGAYPKIEDAGNGWYRCEVYFNGAFGSNELGWGLSDGVDQMYHALNLTDGLYIWGAQAEQNSYTTSYIPTSGSAATRLGETANNAGGAGVFNSEEGVLYAEIAALADDLTNRVISLSDGTTGTVVDLEYNNSTNRIRCFIKIGGSFYATLDKVVSNEKDFHKIAYKYKSGETKLFVDGSLAATSTDTFSMTGLDVLQFARGIPTTSPFYGKTKNIQVFNYALTDEELQTLTT